MDQLFKLGKGLLKDKTHSGGGNHSNHNNYDHNPSGYYGQPPSQPGGYGYQPGYGEPMGYGAHHPGYNQGYNQGYNPGYNPGHSQGYPPNPHGGGGHHKLSGPMAIFKNFDKDGDGMITENDFVIAIRQIGLGGIGESVVRNTFRKLDKNRNGKLDFSEALGAVGTLKGLMGSGHGGHGGHGAHGYSGYH